MVMELTGSLATLVGSYLFAPSNKINALNYVIRIANLKDLVLLEL